MLRFLAITAAALLAAGAAEARTVQLSDIIAQNGGLLPTGRFNIGGAEIEFKTRSSTLTGAAGLAADSKALGRMQAPECNALGQCAFESFESPSKGTQPIEEADLAFVAIYLNGGTRISSLKLADIGPSGRRHPLETLLVNGVSHRFADLANMTFTDKVVLEFGGKRPGEFTLEAFELIETPLPTAGILLLSGIGGALFAMRMRRRRQL
jgi:hypothetical protein